MNGYFLSLQTAVLGELIRRDDWTHWVCVLQDLADEENQ